MTSTPATIKDVALLSGVSTATVSYVVNDGPRRVDPTTRERVLAAMEQLHYQPNTMARGLRRKRVNSVGLVFPQPYPGLVSDSYFGSILDGIIRAATGRRQDVTLYTSLDYDRGSGFRSFQDRRVDGLLLIATLTDSGIEAALEEAGMPYVLINGTPAAPGGMSVDIDNADAAAQVIGHLYQLGHRRIALLGGQVNSPSTLPRREGYLRAMADHGLSVDPALVLLGTYSQEWGVEGMTRLLALERPPTAVFAGGDGIALGAVRTCAARGVSVPGEISVVGFDDAFYAAAADPPLTTMRHPLPEIGTAATHMLLDHLDARFSGKPPHDAAVPTDKLRQVLRAHLIVRESTGPVSVGRLSPTPLSVPGGAPGRRDDDDEGEQRFV